jgi:hypothetical protein
LLIFLNIHTVASAQQCDNSYYCIRDAYRGIKTCGERCDRIWREVRKKIREADSFLDSKTGELSRAERAEIYTAFDDIRSAATRTSRCFAPCAEQGSIELASCGPRARRCEPEFYSSLARMISLQRQFARKAGDFADKLGNTDQENGNDARENLDNATQNLDKATQEACEKFPVLCPRE